MLLLLARPGASASLTSLLLLQGRLRRSFLLAQLLPKSLTPQDVLLRVVSHFTLTFLSVVHVFQTPLLLLLLFFYEFVCETCYWLNPESKRNIYLFHLREKRVEQMMAAPSPLVTFFLSSVGFSLRGGSLAFLCFRVTWRPLPVCCGMMATLQDPTILTKGRHLSSLWQKEGCQILFLMEHRGQR